MPGRAFHREQINQKVISPQVLRTQHMYRLSHLHGVPSQISSKSVSQNHSFTKPLTMEEEARRKFSCNQILGPLLAALSCFFFAISSLFVKLLGEIPPQEVVFFRCLVQFVFLLPPLIYARVPIFGDVQHLPCLFIRALAGTFALCCQFYAFQHLPLADATVIVFSSPIFTGILAYFILGESWGMFNFLGTTLCFIGIILIARPTFMFPREVDPSFNGDWQQATASAGQNSSA